MALSLKQKMKFHKKRMMNPEVNIDKRFFSVGYISGQNLFSDMWDENARRERIKEAYKEVKVLGSAKKLSRSEHDRLYRSKGLIAYTADLKKEKHKEGISLFGKKLK